jgi:RNA polymerase sigma factor (sigma-70 family)
MQLTDDSVLLRQYAENHSDEAFAGLVTRHINLVYSVALRCVGDPHQAEEVAQAVFILLAKKVAQLRHDKALSSWLFQATRLTASNFIRGETRRHRREQEAHMQLVLNDPGNDVWPRIAPLLDDAVAALNEKDRDAIVLRYYEGRSLREVGAVLGASEAAAEKRVSRAVECLREFFTKRGVTVGAGGLIVVISTNAVQAAPVGLAVTISTAASCGATVSVLSTLTKEILLMISAKQKLAIVAAIALLLLLGGTVLLFLNRSQPASQLAVLPTERLKAGFEVRWVAAERDVNSPADVLPGASTNMTPREFRVLKDVVLDGNDVIGAGYGNNRAGSRELVLDLTADGARKLTQSTAGNIGRQLAIVWNDRVINAPTIRSSISGPRVNITGAFSAAEAQTLMDALNHR